MFHPCTLYDDFPVICILMVVHSLFLTQSEGRGKVEVDEEEATYEGKKTVAGSSEPLSRIQELEDELELSEQKRRELIHGNTALQIKLKASQEEEGRIRQEMTSLEERVLPVLKVHVRKMVGLGYYANHLECYFDPNLL